MHLLRVTVGIYLPPGGRPDPGAIVSWFERALLSEEATTQRLEDGSLEFTTPVVTERQSWRPRASLQGLAAGILEVEHQPHGFDVVVQAQPRTWLLVAPAMLMGLLYGPMLPTPEFRVGVTAAGIVLTAGAWLNGWLHLRSLVRVIAEDIMRSYATIPHKAPERLSSAQ